MPHRSRTNAAARCRQRCGLALALATVAMLACTPPTPPPPPGSGDASRADGGAGNVHQAPASLKACAELAAQVDTITGAVQQLNRLPMPVGPACFVASLARPLKVVATTSILSAQPAGPAGSPRLFILQPGVALSVVPAGAGSPFLEMGEWTTSTRTLKGELAFPVTSPLALDAPFTRVSHGHASGCGTCHRAESPHPTVPGAFDSAAFRPEPSTLVKVEALQAEHQACIDAGDESERCLMFHALFDFGTVRQGAFANDVALFVP